MDVYITYMCIHLCICIHTYIHPCTNLPALVVLNNMASPNTATWQGPLQLGSERSPGNRLCSPRHVCNCFGTNTHSSTVDSKRLGLGRRRMYDGCPSFLGSGLEDGHVPAFSSLLHSLGKMGARRCIASPSLLGEQQKNSDRG